jgi:hypothetical protein
LTVVDSGGEIVALDAAGYGAVTITKSVTITANPGYFAGIAAATSSAVTIDTPGVNVTLRGLNINGTGALFGVSVYNAGRVSIENCVLSNFPQVAIQAGAGALRVVDTTFRDNNLGIGILGGVSASIAGSTFSGQGGNGVHAQGHPSGVATKATITDSRFNSLYVAVTSSAGEGSSSSISITRSSITNSDFGVFTSGSGTAAASISHSLVASNVIGFRVDPGTVIESLGNNHVRQNGTDVMGALTPVPQL